MDLSEHSFHACNISSTNGKGQSRDSANEQLLHVAPQETRLRELRKLSTVPWALSTWLMVISQRAGQHLLLLGQIHSQSHCRLTVAQNRLVCKVASFGSPPLASYGAGQLPLASPLLSCLISAVPPLHLSWPSPLALRLPRRRSFPPCRRRCRAWRGTWLRGRPRPSSALALLLGGPRRTNGARHRGP